MSWVSVAACSSVRSYCPLALIYLKAHCFSMAIVCSAYFCMLDVHIIPRLLCMKSISHYLTLYWMYWMQCLYCRIRCIGSAALNACSVAAGQADAYYEYGLHIWDMAAAHLIAHEAGAVCCNPAGK